MIEEEVQVSLRDELGRVFEEADPVDDDAPENSVGVEEEIEATEEGETAESADVERSEEEIPTEEKDAEDVEKDQPPEKERTEEDPLEPLAHWRREDRELFKTLSPEAQEFLIRRDKDFQSSATQKQMEVADIKHALDPIRKDLEEYGVSEADAVRRLVAAHIRLQRNPQEALIELGSAYGIDLSAILNLSEEDGSSDSAATRKIRELEKRLEEAEKRTQYERVSEMQQMIDKFAANHEFYKDVEPQMAAIAWSYRSRNQKPPSLEEMYDEACWANPTIRGKLLEKRETEKQKSKETEEKERLNKAKRAKRAEVKSTRVASGKQEGAGKRSLRDDLRKAMEGRDA